MINLRSLSKEINFKIYDKGPHVIVSEIIKSYLGCSNYICVVPVHGLSLSLQKKNFNFALTNSLFNVPDGMPVALYASYKYGKKVERIYGPDLMLNLLEKMNKIKKNSKVFLLGGHHNTIDINRLHFRCHQDHLCQIKPH